MALKNYLRHTREYNKHIRNCNENFLNYPE